MSDETSDGLNKLLGELGKLVRDVEVIVTVVFYVAIAVTAAATLYFVWVWVANHPKQVILIAGCLALWITRALLVWRK
jgi:hypothetical protein